MRKLVRTAVAALLMGGLLGPLSAASAGGGGNDDVERQGRCSKQSRWELKGGVDDGKLDIEFEVDQNVNGEKWRVVLKRNDTRIYRKVKTTKAPSGSFTVDKKAANPAGSDTIRARARNLGTDEVCRGKIEV
ncbi:MAG: hypothetical protein ACRDKZ_14270 [Actinomycetota bacterium]